jgi:hypothetical protein
MLRTVILAALCAVLFASNVEARQRHRHHAAQCVETGTVLQPVCGMGLPVVRNFRTTQATDRTHGFVLLPENPAISRRESRRLARGQELYDAMPFGMPTDRAGRAVPAWAARATARPRAWCGWWLARQRGIRDARLNLARNWAHLYGSPSRPQPGAVVVWPHHVGELISHVSGNVWIVRSGNDGNAVRERPRSIAGAIAFRA